MGRMNHAEFSCTVQPSYLEEQSTLASRARTNFPFTVLNTMQKAAGVEDNRRQQN